MSKQMATSRSRGRGRLACVLERMLFGVALMAQRAGARPRFAPPLPPPPSPSWMSAREPLLEDSPRLLGPRAQLGSQMGADVVSEWAYDDLLEKRLEEAGDPQRPFMDQPLGQVQKTFGADIDLDDTKVHPNPVPAAASYVWYFIRLENPNEPPFGERKAAHGHRLRHPAPPSVVRKSRWRPVFGPTPVFHLAPLSTSS